MIGGKRNTMRQTVRKRSAEPHVAVKRTRVRRIADRELTREDWIAVARRALIEEGVAAVRVERLAKTLGVTRGGFYWRFSNLDDLLGSLVEDWRVNNSRAYFQALSGSGSLGDRFDALVAVWVDEKDYIPAWDTAMREWARISPKVADAVHAVDDERINALQQLFSAFGELEEVALVRARVIYFHQVGYYALGVREDRARRESLVLVYKAILTGIDPTNLLHAAPQS